MVVSAPADNDDQRDPEMDTFYLSEYHMQGARYHGGPSDEAYLTQQTAPLQDYSQSM